MPTIIYLEENCQMNKLPCIDCITLSICRGIFEDNQLVYDNGLARNALMERCSIINSYLNPPFSKISIINLRKHALNVFMLYGEIEYDKYL